MSSPMASLELNDSSQLTSDTQHLGYYVNLLKHNLMKPIHNVRENSPEGAGTFLSSDFSSFFAPKASSRDNRKTMVQIQTKRGATIYWIADNREAMVQIQTKRGATIYWIADNRVAMAQHDFTDIWDAELFDYDTCPSGQPSDEKTANFIRSQRGKGKNTGVFPCSNCGKMFLEQGL
uniref:Uncharacterized protein n=1 Tax=Timema shepardi TaxID=629360 RepID=A0A7R9AMJ6_TIMSH|nr:unnamed protein product [Timema shepardi]